MRRAVIGTFVNKGAGSEEIVDVLTEYAAYLAQTRHLAEAHSLFIKLAPYAAYFPHYNPKYLHFQSVFLRGLSDIGIFSAVDAVYKSLSDNVAAVYIVPPSVRSQLFYQVLYQLARTPSAEARALTTERLKQMTSRDPHFLKQPRNRVTASYFAMLAGDVELADQFNSATQATEPIDPQFAAYEIILKSYIAARHNDVADSATLGQEGLNKIALYLRGFEGDSPNHSPTPTVAERLILSLDLGVNSPHISTYEQADAFFKLAQFLNRDKLKLGLNERVAREELKSDLQREDMRTRDRLKDLRDRIVDEAVDSLFTRIIPIRSYAPVQNNDFGYLFRLEDIEDKIESADTQLRLSVPSANQNRALTAQLS